MNPAETLRAAEQRVQQGWCQGAAEWRGKVCTLGAIVDVVRNGLAIGYVDAAEALRKSLDVISVVEWNDTPGRTQEQVATAMLRAADQWEQDHPDQVAPPVVWTARERVLA